MITNYPLVLSPITEEQRQIQVANSLKKYRRGRRQRIRNRQYQMKIKGGATKFVEVETVGMETK